MFTCTSSERKNRHFNTENNSFTVTLFNLCFLTSNHLMVPSSIYSILPTLQPITPSAHYRKLMVSILGTTAKVNAHNRSLYLFTNTRTRLEQACNELGSCYEQQVTPHPPMLPDTTTFPVHIYYYDKTLYKSNKAPCTNPLGKI